MVMNDSGVNFLNVLICPDFK